MKRKSIGILLAVSIVGCGAVFGVLIFSRENSPRSALPAVPAPLASDIKAIHPLRAALNNHNWQAFSDILHKDSSPNDSNSKPLPNSHREKEEAIKILNSFLDSGNTLPAEVALAIEKALLAETFHETGPSRRLAVLAAHVLSKLPEPDDVTKNKWLKGVKLAQKKVARKDQFFIWVEASSGWTPFPSVLSQNFKKFFNKDNFQNDIIYLIQKIKDPQAKNQLIAELLKSKGQLRPEYRKIVEERFRK